MNLYISSLNSQAPAALQASTSFRQSAALNRAPVGLCGKLTTTIFTPGCIIAYPERQHKSSTHAHS